MLGTQFYNQAVRKTVISFGTLFNNIELKKIVDGQVMETEKVPQNLPFSYEGKYKR